MGSHMAIAYEFGNNIGFYGRNINRGPKLQKHGHLFLLL